MDRTERFYKIEHLLTPHVQPLLERLRTLLSGDDRSPEEIERRIRIIGTRPPQGLFYEA